MTVVVRLGQRWRPGNLEDAPSWRVVSIRPERVGLSGPGPCRGMKYATMAELRDFWTLVEDTVH